MANGAASVGNAVLEHPDILGEILGGAALTAAGVAGEAGGLALDATGAGAVGGVPLNIASAGAVAGGLGIAGHGLSRLFNEAAGGSRAEPVPKRKGYNRGDDRDDYGQFANGQNERPWFGRQEAGLKEVEEERGVKVIRDEIVARVEGGNANGRRYDGLYKNPDGTYTGIEIKSGKKYRNRVQELFDSIVNSGKPATAKLDGETITIVKVIKKEVD